MALHSAPRLRVDNAASPPPCTESGQAMRILRRLTVVTVALAPFAVAPSPALAETLSFTADLKGTNAVPSVETGGNGSVSAQYDTATQMLSWAVNYSGVTSDVTAADFTGPAEVRHEAARPLRIDGALASPIEGAATLDRVQAAALISGNWYFNLHTMADKSGAIRGQLIKLSTPHN
jgi:hypothetical protein